MLSWLIVKATSLVPRGTFGPRITTLLLSAVSSIVSNSADVIITVSSGDGVVYNRGVVATTTFVGAGVVATTTFVGAGVVFTTPVAGGTKNGWYKGMPLSSLIIT